MSFRRFGCWVFLILLISLSLACAPGPGDAATGQGEASGEDYRPDGWPARTLPEIAAALQAGEVSSEQVVQAYLDRIERIDRSGPELRSVLALNPRALEDAREADAARAAGQDLGPLHGVPLLLKDNIESADPVATTAGSLALEANLTERDSPLVAGLRAAGAIILGKTNLSQWANFRSRDSMSGWSSLGGQVRNPHMTDRNPCGSSSGSGVAVAASLGAGAVGTETNGSIICPSTINGVVGFKPTVGLVSQQYIVPISFSQDTAGPMTKTVRGTAMMLTAMATGEGKTDYVAALDENALAGKRIGVLRFATGSNADTIALFDAAVAAMEEAGATPVEIESFDTGVENWGAKSAMLMETEFKATLDAYLADAAAAVEVRSLEELIAFNKRHAAVELALFDQSLFELSVERKGTDDPEYIAARDEVQRAVRQNGIDRLLAEHEVDVLVSPSGPVAPRIDPVNGDVWPSWAGAGWMAAVAGYPHLSVPMGEVHGLPAGISFMAGAGDDAAVIAIGYAYEQRTRLRVEPGYLSGAEARPEIGDAMRGTVER